MAQIINETKIITSFTVESNKTKNWIKIYINEDGIVNDYDHSTAFTFCNDHFDELALMSDVNYEDFINLISTVRTKLRNLNE